MCIYSIYSSVCTVQLVTTKFTVNTFIENDVPEFTTSSGFYNCKHLMME